MNRFSFPRFTAVAAAAALTLALSGVAAPGAELLPTDAMFSKTAQGQTPGAPWKANSEGRATVTRESPPISEASQDWVLFKDEDPTSPATLYLPISQVSKGVIRFQLHVPEMPATLGVYLGVDRATSAGNRIVDFKVMESGLVYIGAHGERTRTDLRITGGGQALQVEIRFARTDAGEHIELLTGEPGTELTPLFQGDFAGGGVADSLRVTTDSKTDASTIYIGELSLQSQE